MKLKILQSLFSYAVTLTLLALAGLLHSSPFAYAAVIGLLITIGKEALGGYLESKVFKSTMPDEVKKKLQELEVRITSIEVGIQRRGF